MICPKISKLWCVLLYTLFRTCEAKWMQSMHRSSSTSATGVVLWLTGLWAIHCAVCVHFDKESKWHCILIKYISIVHPWTQHDTVHLWCTVWHFQDVLHLDSHPTLDFQCQTGVGLVVVMAEGMGWLYVWFYVSAVSTVIREIGCVPLIWS